MRIGIDCTNLLHDSRGMGRYVRSLIPILLQDRSHEFFLLSRKGGVWNGGEIVPFSAVESSLDLCWYPWNLLHFPVSCKKICTIHDVIIFRFPKQGWLRKREQRWEENELRKSGTEASRVIADACFSRSEIVKFLEIEEEKVSVVYPGVDLSLFSPQPSEKIREVIQKYGIREPYLLYVGALQPSKNIIRLARVFLSLKEKHLIPHSLVMAGGIQTRGGFRKELLTVTKRKRSKGAVQGGVSGCQATFSPHEPPAAPGASGDLRDDQVLTGEVAEEDLPALYSGASLFLFPSLYEGFGLPVLEAMGCGAPVISSTAASLPEACGDAAVLVDPEDADEMGKAILRLLEDQRLRRDLIEKGFHQARKFTWERAATEILTIFREVGEKG